MYDILYISIFYPSTRPFLYHALLFAFWTTFSTFLQPSVNKPLFLTSIPYFDDVFKHPFFLLNHNLLSNACKYNTSKGKVEISLKETELSIKNSSYGVNHPERVFDRFYKESERGLGIGLHIVDKLCQSLKIDKKFMLEGTDVIVELECKNIIT